jgi:acyl-coenzyme A thioesterase PaaI-like protein
MIPFNKPHGFQIVELDDYSVRVRIPYKRKNFNHIRGLHACALATISEFATGFVLTTKLSPKKYRLIMRRLEMDYHYQGKMDAYAEFSIDEQWLTTNIHEPLKTGDIAEINCEVKIFDKESNHLTTGHVHWQVKDWARVKTKIEN